MGAVHVYLHDLYCRYDVSCERLYVMQTRHELSPATAVKSKKKIVAKNSTDVEN